jgi:Protein of unknwon function (DUF3008)
MPSVSKAQQRFMGMVHAAQKGEMDNPSPEVEKAADSMTDKAAKDFASTKHKGLPNHVKKENKIDLEDEDLPSAALPVSAENTMKGYDASCGCFRTEPVKESLIKEDMDTIYLSLILIAQAAALGGNLAMLRSAAKGYYNLGPIDSIKKWWKDRKDDKSVKSIIAKIKSDPEMIAFFKMSQTQQRGKFRKLVATKLSSDEIQYLNRINKSDLQQNESADVNQNAVMASIEDLPNNRTQKNFPLPTNRILWNATGKVCEGRPVVERIKMYEKKGGGWREGVQGDEQVYNSLKELYYERKKVEEIKESVRVILKKKVQTESKLNEDISDVVMGGLQMIGIVGAGFFFRFLIRYMIGEFLKSTKDTTMNGIKSIIQSVKNAFSSLKNMSRIHQLEKELENDADIKHAVLHPKTIDFAKVLKRKLQPKDYDLISKITRNNFR